MSEYYKEDQIPVAEYCEDCGESFPLGTEVCQVCGKELTTV